MSKRREEKSEQQNIKDRKLRKKHRGSKEQYINKGQCDPEVKITEIKM